MTLPSAFTRPRAGRALPCSAFLLALASGCYNTQPSNATDEAKAAAEALTRSLTFTGGRLEDGEMPDTDDDDVRLLPLESDVVIEPGVSSVMSLTPDNPKGSEDPIVVSLLQFGKAGQHFEVDVGDEVGSGSGTIRHMFSVDEDVCEKLCNKRFTVEVRERARTRSGKIGQTATRNVQLECSQKGSPKFCARKPSSTGPLEERVLDKLDECGFLQRRGELNVLEALPCAWECVADASCTDVGILVCDEDGEPSTSLASCFASECSVTDTLFSCDNGNSVDRFVQCDGEDDCGDGSDEESCSDSQFQCGGSDGETVPMSWVCDQYEDCLNGHDEDGCAVLSCGGDIGPAGSGGSGGSGGGDEPVAGSGGMGGTGGTGGTGGGGADMGSPIPCTLDDDCPSNLPLCITAMSGGLTASFCSVSCDTSATCPILAGLQLVCLERVCNLPQQ